jgi:hypothetical protein
LICDLIFLIESYLKQYYSRKKTLESWINSQPRTNYSDEIETPVEFWPIYFEKLNKYSL